MNSEITRTETGITNQSEMKWAKEKRDLIMRQFVPSGGTEFDLQFFESFALRTGLDPMLGQCFLIERSGKDSSGNWVKKFSPMAAVAGLGALVDQQEDCEGHRGSAVYEGDVFEIDTVAGVPKHNWSPVTRAKAGNKLIGAWYQCKRRARITPVIWLPFESRVQLTKDGAPNKFWKSDPAGQILKCARAEAYRQSYPNMFSGVFIPEEMREEDPEEQSPKMVDVSPIAKSTALLGRLTTPKASPPKSETEIHQPAPAPPKQQAGELEIFFGPHKKTKFSDASSVQLTESLDWGTETILKCNGSESNYFKLVEGVKELQAELEKREKAIE